MLAFRQKEAIEGQQTFGRNFNFSLMNYSIVSKSLLGPSVLLFSYSTGNSLRFLNAS